MLARLGLAAARQKNVMARAAGRAGPVESGTKPGEVEAAVDWETILMEQEMNTMIRALQETTAYPVRLRPVGAVRRDRRPAGRPATARQPQPLSGRSNKSRTP